MFASVFRTEFVQAKDRKFDAFSFNNLDSVTVCTGHASRFFSAGQGGCFRPLSRLLIQRAIQSFTGIEAGGLPPAECLVSVSVSRWTLRPSGRKLSVAETRRAIRPPPPAPPPHSYGICPN